MLSRSNVIFFSCNLLNNNNFLNLLNNVIMIIWKMFGEECSDYLICTTPKHSKHQVLIKYFFIFRVSKEYIGIVVFCIRDYTWRVRIHSILKDFFLNFGLHLWVPEERNNLRWISILSKLEKSPKHSKRC